jgi:hypothetical protein
MNKLMTAGIVMLVFVLIGAGYFAYASYGETVPENSSDLTPTDPTATPTPSPSPGASTIPSITGSGKLWQSIYIKNTDGSAYWYNAPQPFDLRSIFGSPSGDAADFTQVSTFQNNIYMKLDSSLGTVTSWTFSCQETIAVTDTSGNLIGKITDKTTVNANGQSVTAGSNTWVTGATLTAAQLQDVIGQVAPTTSGTQYYIVITLTNIQLTLNGQVTLTSDEPGSSNTLSWLIKIS